MKVKYIGDYYKVYLRKGFVYEATLSEDGCWYMIYDEDDEDTYGYLVSDFEVVEPQQ